MYMKLSKEEQKRIESIKKVYAEQINDISEKIQKSKNEDEKKDLRIKYQSIREICENDIFAFLEQCQEKRFEPIRRSGDAAIIKNAKKQIPLLLDEIRNAYVDINIDKLSGKSKDEILINANFVAKEIKEELKLHIKALQENKDALYELLSMIIECVEKSEYTDNSKLTVFEEKENRIAIRQQKLYSLANINYFGIMNDKVSTSLLEDPDEIFKKVIDGQISIKMTYDINQHGGINDKNQVPVYLSLTYEGEDISINRKVTAFDKQVYEAISVLHYYWKLENNNKPLYITPSEVWGVMNGKKKVDRKSKPSESKIQKICKSIDKMRVSLLYMDYSQEIQKYNLMIDDERFSGGKVEENLLNARKIVLSTDQGKESIWYWIKEEPILYTYNKAKDRVLFVPYELLDTSAFLSDSENVTEFRGYLLQQIQLMKYSKEQSREKGKKGFNRNNIILIDTIYKATGIKTPEERANEKHHSTENAKKSTARRILSADLKKIESIFDSWIDRKWISGYSPINQKGEPPKAKQPIHGYKIKI